MQFTCMSIFVIIYLNVVEKRGLKRTKFWDEGSII
jgi:hypothetical protein